MEQHIDHFHCYFTFDGKPNEIEGGITQPQVERLRAMTIEDRKTWELEAALDWGMPEGATITDFKYAG
jgi:hypothetical protein